MMLRELKLRGIKILDISYLATIYFFIYITIAIILNKITEKIFKPKIYPQEKKSSIRLILEIIPNLCIIAVSYYLCRNFVGIIPFPLDKVDGFNHFQVKEIGGGGPLGFLMISNQKYLMRNVAILSERLSLSLNKII